MYRLRHLLRVIIDVGLKKNNSNKEGVVKKPYSMSECSTDDPFRTITKVFVGICFCCNDVWYAKSRTCGNNPVDTWYGLLCLRRYRVSKYQHYFREFFSCTWVLEKFTSKSVLNKRLETFMVFVCLCLWLFDTYVTDTFVCSFIRYLSALLIALRSRSLRLAIIRTASMPHSPRIPNTTEVWAVWSGIHVTVRNLEKKTTV